MSMKESDSPINTHSSNIVNFHRTVIIDILMGVENVKSLGIAEKCDIYIYIYIYIYMYYLSNLLILLLNN